MIAEQESMLAGRAQPLVRSGSGWRRVIFELRAEHLAKSNVPKLQAELCDSVKLAPLLPHGSAEGISFRHVWVLDPLHMLINTWRNVESFAVLAGIFWVEQAADGIYQARSAAERRRMLKQKLAQVRKDLNTADKAVVRETGPYLQSEIDSQASCKRPMMGHDGTDCAKLLRGHTSFLALPGMAALCNALGTFEGESLLHAWLRCLQTIMRAALARFPSAEPHKEPALLAAVKQLQRIYNDACVSELGINPGNYDHGIFCHLLAQLQRFRSLLAFGTQSSEHMNQELNTVRARNSTHGGCDVPEEVVLLLYTALSQAEEIVGSEPYMENPQTLD